MQEVTFSYRVIEFLFAAGVIACGIAWYGFRAKVRGLYTSLNKSQEEVKTLSSKLEQAAAEKSRVEAEFAKIREKYNTLRKTLADKEAAFEDLSRRSKAREQQWADREAKLRDTLQTLQGEGEKTFIREWTGFYQVIIRSFLNVPVQAQGYIRIARMLERHSFDITVDPEEDYPQIVRSLPGSPVA